MTEDVRIKEETNELQNYLDSFNAEFDDGGVPSISILPNDEEEADGDDPTAAEEDDDDDGGTYFVDQAGNFYYQETSDTDPIPTEPPEHIRTTLLNSAAATGKYDFTEKETAKKESKNESYIVLIDNKDGESKPAIFEFDENEEAENYEMKCKQDLIPLVKIKKKITSQANGGQVHQCSCCEYITSKRYLLSRHMKCHSDERPHKCSVCERGFKTSASLQNHVNTHTGNKPHNCKFCPSNFTTSGELVRHVRYKHTHERPHKCTQCDYASVELSKLKRHIRCHTGERPYQCPHCTYASPDTFKLKRHLRIHTGEKPYECDICHARFTQSNSLKAHKLIHSVGDKPVFQCELCPTTCGRKTDLRIHVQKLHTSEKPINCKRCGKNFPDRYTYKIHSKTHDGEKCFKCDMCAYASISERHLETHMLIHTDQKPFQCDYCLQAFRQRQLLRRHLNLYHIKDYVPPTPREKTHNCPHCDRNFSHKGNLIRHMASHDPENVVIKKEKIESKEAVKRALQIDENVEYLTEPDSDNFIAENEEEMEEGEPDEEAIETYIDELYDEDDDDENDRTEDEIEIKQEDENSRLISMDCGDGQQYVVLEVIQCDDDEDEVDDEQQDDHDVGGEDDDVAMDEEYLSADLPNKILAKDRNKATVSSTQSDMANCFGFNDIDELDSDDCEVDNKSSIKLLELETE